MTRIYKGGCLCGNIRFEAEGPPQKSHTCSCKMCQRHTGAVTVHWAEFPASRLRWTGEGGTPRTWRSSSHSSRAFCGACGSTLGAIDDKPVVALVLGVFDSNNRLELAPNHHFSKARRPKWFASEIE